MMLVTSTDGNGDAAPPKQTRERSKIAGHGAKFSRKMEEAIAALVAHRTVEEAARAVHISAPTLYRWMKIPEFQAAYREARQAIVRQATGRLQQASATAVTILLKVMYDSGAARSARLKAADRVLSYIRGTSRIEEIGARLLAVKRSRETSRPERLGRADGAAPAEERGSPERASRGAKSDRKREEAIVALLTQRNVEEAARVAGMGITTLYRRMKDTEFAAAYQEARLAAFGQAGARLQQASNPAATVILKIMVDPGSPGPMQVRAADLVLKHAIEASEEDIQRCLAELKRARPAGAPVLAGSGRTFEQRAPGRPKVAA
jgi:predicted DNA-binding transcriptional regulator AlpA